jgi:hypothetical protein
MITKHWLYFGVFGVALLVNPYLACSGSDEEDFTYSEQDMKAAILGEWEGSADVDGTSVPFSLSLEQASATSRTQSVSAPSVEPQCGSRSFVKPAAACASESVMPLVGTITSANAGLNGAVTGELSASRILDKAGLRLQLEDGRTLSGQLSGNEVSDGRIFTSTQVGTFSMTRP